MQKCKAKLEKVQRSVSQLVPELRQINYGQKIEGGKK